MIEWVLNALPPGDFSKQYFGVYHGWEICWLYEYLQWILKNSNIYILSLQFFILSFTYDTAQKTFFFPNVLKRWPFQNKSHWNIIFLVLSGKIIFIFPKNMILLFRRKRKNDFSQKNPWKYDVFFKCSEKMVFPKSFTGTWSF